MFLERTVNPVALPVDIDYVVKYLKLDGDADEIEVLTELAGRAVDKAEKFTGRSFMTQTWRLILDPPDISSFAIFDIPRRPIQSITSVKVFDRENNSTTISSSDYTLIDHLLYFKNNLQSTNGFRDERSVEIVYVAGYADIDAVPSAIKHAIEEYINYYYDNHGCTDTAFNKNFENMLRPYKIYSAEGVGRHPYTANNYGYYGWNY